MDAIYSCNIASSLLIRGLYANLGPTNSSHFIYAWHVGTQGSVTRSKFLVALMCAVLMSCSIESSLVDPISPFPPVFFFLFAENNMFPSTLDIQAVADPEMEHGWC